LELVDNCLSNVVYALLNGDVLTKLIHHNYLRLLDKTIRDDSTRLHI